MSPDDSFVIVPEDFAAKLSALERIHESRLRVDATHTDTARREALAQYDQAIKEFQQLLRSEHRTVASVS